ncbi:MAG TPA: DUF5655 domain-containing protein [Bryobacteraceae bacterium]|nr:DUF5655 domain-containing protein [Bryobacteraceae bacterium]
MEPNALSAAGPVAVRLYKQLLSALRTIGPFQEEVKKTSIHLVRKTAFAGVQPWKEHLNLTIKAAKAIRSVRIYKSEQTSKSRWHHEVKLAAVTEIDTELLRWLREAYELSA